MLRRGDCIPKLEHEFLKACVGLLAVKKYGLKVEYEPKLNEGYRPDLRLTKRDLYPINLEVEMKGGKRAYKIKKKKADKLHSVLLWVDGTRFELESRTVTWVLDQLDFLIEQAMIKAEVPVVTIKYTENWPWLKKAKVGEEIVSPRRITKYRLLHSKIGKLGLIQIKVNGTFEDKLLVRISDCKKVNKDTLKKRVLTEYQTSIFNHDRDDKGMVCLVYFEVVEILKEDTK